MTNYKTLVNILWQSKEGIACKKAIDYFNAHFDEWSAKKQQENIKKFQTKFDDPLNAKWEQIKKLYRRKIKCPF